MSQDSPQAIAAIYPRNVEAMQSLADTSIRAMELSGMTKSMAANFAGVGPVTPEDGAELLGSVAASTRSADEPFITCAAQMMTAGRAMRPRQSTVDLSVASASSTRRKAA
jgi:hypothetical protein